jgi:hypothetical protein
MTTFLHPAARPGNPWIAGIRPADYGLVGFPRKRAADFCGARRQNPQGPQNWRGIATAPATIEHLNEPAGRIGPPTPPFRGARALRKLLTHGAKFRGLELLRIWLTAWRSLPVNLHGKVREGLSTVRGHRSGLELL